jgi:hypothetical protein
MKLTLEHAIIAVVALVLIYYMVQHRNLVKDVSSIPDRGHPELKGVKDKHVSNFINNFLNNLSSSSGGYVSGTPWR